MGFKSIEQYNEEKYNGKFVLKNDGDFADVIFLYQSVKDVLVADVHYIKSADYSGYVHCNGKGCPVCAKGVRVQTKLFVPVYNITEGEIQFWDRSTSFEPQLYTDVFSKYPNPSEFVFRITRHGFLRDINTTYQIIAIGNNIAKSYVEILSEKSAQFPDYYENICREVDAVTLSSWLNNANSEKLAITNLPDYIATPRRTPLVTSKIPDIDMINEDIDEPVDFN